MQVILNTTRADRVRRYNIGDTIDVPDDEARRLIESGQARPVRASQMEFAVPDAGAEYAVRHPKRKSQRGAEQ